MLYNRFVQIHNDQNYIIWTLLNAYVLSYFSVLL